MWPEMSNSEDVITRAWTCKNRAVKGLRFLVGRGALPSTRLFGDRCRIEIGFSAVMGQGLECREEHFVRKQLRGQNSLQDKSLDQGVNHTDQMLRRHG